MIKIEFNSLKYTFILFLLFVLTSCDQVSNFKKKIYGNKKYTVKAYHEDKVLTWENVEDIESECAGYYEFTVDGKYKVFLDNYDLVVVEEKPTTPCKEAKTPDGIEYKICQ